jgi:hypothetical protein
MSYKEKYLKYKSKYLNFKAMINNQSGGGVVDIMNISQLSDTPTETKNKSKDNMLQIVCCGTNCVCCCKQHIISYIEFST